MAKLTFVLLAVVAVVVLATTEAKSVEGKKGSFVAIQSPKPSVGADCDCDTCSTECISSGYVGGLCYEDECYCAYFN